MEGKLWTIRTKLKGLADLLQGHNPEHLLDEDGFYGLGQILIEIVEDLQDLVKELPLKKK